MTAITHVQLDAATLLEQYENLPGFITVRQAAELAGLSKSSAYRAAERGELPVVRMGGRLLVPVGALLTLMGLIEPIPAATTPWVTDIEHLPA